MTTWNDVSARLGRNDLPAALAYAVAEGRLTDPVEIARGLDDAWTMCEWPGRAMDYDVWESLFALALDDDEYLHDGEIRSKADLPETITLYRGAHEEHEQGMSWTASFERAHWFATRLAMFSGPHRIFKIEATPDMILAYSHERRSEQEYVLATYMFDAEDMEVVAPEAWPELLDECRSSVSSTPGGG